MSLMFVNTRSQAEMLFQELWRINDDGLAIALHHGSLDTAQRRKVEAAMAAGRLQAVVWPVAFGTGCAVCASGACAGGVCALSGSEIAPPIAVVARSR